MNRFYRFLLFYCFAAVFFCGTASAIDVRIGNFDITYGQRGGNAALDYVTMDQINEDAQEDIHDLDIRRNFTTVEKREIELAVRYWDERMGANRPVEQVHIYFGIAGTEENGSAFSLSPSQILIEELTGGISPNGTVYDKFLLGRKSPYPNGLADNIIIDEIGYPSTPTRLLIDDFSIMSTMIHEMGHALGIMTDHTVEGDGTRAVFEAEKFTAWNSHLHDVFGKKAEPDMVIMMNVVEGDRASENDPEIFQIFSQEGNNANYLYPTFRGENVDALTGGRGMTVMGGFSGADTVMDGANSLGHPGIMQSVMSYGIIRNMPFTELELAAFQDMGYVIDRSQFFGKSYYHNVGGSTQVNRTPFGTADNPNTAVFGLGTHIMRNWLTLTQEADIHAGGYGGGGVRIDGVGNRLTIPQHVIVAAKGDMGTGLLFSYGSQNRITLEGRVEAAGSGGIAAHFGILAAGNGHGLMIGSHMPAPEPYFAAFYEDVFDTFAIQTQYEFLKAHEDMSGPLVQEFIISGHLSGSLAAIQIEEDAHVANIAVRNGAVISGDIVSHWASDTWYWLTRESYPATITFGEQGKSGIMLVDGDIIWRGPREHSLGEENSLNIVQLGGHLNFNSRNNGTNVQSWQINAGAILSGNSSITIDGDDPFYNAGTISPGNSIGVIAIDGDYEQAASGNLLMEFTPTETDQFIVTGSAVIDPDATLSLQALPAFYPTGVGREITNLEMFGHSPELEMALFEEIRLVTITSPTLGFGLDESPGGSLLFIVTREEDAYSQYGTGTTGTSVGNALYGISAQPTGDMQHLFAAIDFSSADGSEVRSALRQLAPTVYDNTARASLHMGHAISGLLLERITAARTLATLPSFADGQNFPDLQNRSNSAFVFPLGGYFGQSRWDDNYGFNSIYGGAMGGVNRHVENGLYGLHAAVFHRDTSSRSESTARSRANGVRFGVHGALLPREGFFVGGIMSTGLEKTDMTRNVEFNGYQRSNSSSFTAFTAQGAMRAGYEWTDGDFRFGPLGGFDYGYYRRPSLTEENGLATRLRLDSANFHSLRTALGGQLRSLWQLSGDRTLHAGLSILWMHELLDTDSGSTASFVGYSENGFTVKNRRSDRDALALNASLALLSSESVNIGFYLGTELFRSNSSSVQGGFSANWRF